MCFMGSKSTIGRRITKSKGMVAGVLHSMSMAAKTNRQRLLTKKGSTRTWRPRRTNMAVTTSVAL